VTGLDPQVILMHLLHNERNTMLVTRGPYNGMFERSQEGPGEAFSIDKAVDLSTMLASGYIVLKVLSEKGEHLICLDVRKGSLWDAANRNNIKNYLACMDLEKDSMQDDSRVQKTVRIEREKSHEEKPRVLLLKYNEFRWNKMLGLYVGNSSFG
jgi:hypothetical protein